RQVVSTKVYPFRHEVTKRAENRNSNQLLNNYFVKVPIKSLMENYRILPLMSKDNLSINAVKTFKETTEKRREMDICIQSRSVLEFSIRFGLADLFKDLS